MRRTEMYTVKQLAKLAGVSVRTLHYYDQIGLLKPSAVRANGYRAYDQACLLRLQQILFFRELDFSLKEIQRIVASPDFDVQRALRAHKRELGKRARRLERLMQTIDATLAHMKGEREMSDTEMFAGFDEARQKEYEAEARERWGAEAVDASARRWNAYSAEQKRQIMAEAQAYVQDLAALSGGSPAGQEAQAVVARWARHLEYFYEPSLDVLRGLGRMYVEDARFAANYEKVQPGLAEFFSKAIAAYCDARGEAEGGRRKA